MSVGEEPRPEIETVPGVPFHFEPEISPRRIAAMYYENAWPLSTPRGAMYPNEADIVGLMNKLGEIANEVQGKSDGFKEGGRLLALRRKDTDGIGIYLNVGTLFPNALQPDAPIGANA